MTAGALVVAIVVLAGVAWVAKGFVDSSRYGSSSMEYQGTVWRTLNSIPFMDRQEIATRKPTIFREFSSREALFAPPNPHKSATSVANGLRIMREAALQLDTTLGSDDPQADPLFNQAYNRFYTYRKQLLQYCEMNRNQ